MTPETARLVQRSFRHLLPDMDAIAAAFFARLFVEAPAMARLVPAGAPAQRRMLIAATAFAIETLDDFDHMVPALRAAGAHLGMLGAGQADYDRMRAALLDTLAEVLGAAWTPPLGAAWSEAYGAVAAAMQDAPADKRAAA